MIFEIQYPRNATPGPARTVLYSPAYTDKQLAELGEAVKTALGELFVQFSAQGDDSPTHVITVEWLEVDYAAEIGVIDGVIVAWLAVQAQLEGE